jgi:hypothetical protein
MKLLWTSFRVCRCSLLSFCCCHPLLFGWQIQSAEKTLTPQPLALAGAWPSLPPLPASTASQHSRPGSCSPVDIQGLPLEPWHCTLTSPHRLPAPLHHLLLLPCPAPADPVSPTPGLFICNAVGLEGALHDPLTHLTGFPVPFPLSFPFCCTLARYTLALGHGVVFLALFSGRTSKPVNKVALIRRWLSEPAPSLSGLSYPILTLIR